MEGREKGGKNLSMTESSRLEMKLIPNRILGIFPQGIFGKVKNST